MVSVDKHWLNQTQPSVEQQMTIHSFIRHNCESIKLHHILSCLLLPVASFILMHHVAGDKTWLEYCIFLSEQIRH